MVKSGKITTKDTVLYKGEEGGLYINRTNAQGNTDKPVQFTVTKELWEASKKENTITLYYEVDKEPIGIRINAINSIVQKEEVEADGTVTVTCRNITKLVFGDRELSTGPHIATGKTWTSSQGVWVPAYTSSYKLEEIDNLREYILKQGKREILIKANSTEEWLGTSFIKDVLVGAAKEGETDPNLKMPIIQMEISFGIKMGIFIEKMVQL